MNALRQLRRQERHRFPSVCAKIQRQVNDVLREEFDKEIFRLTPHNAQRLLTLRVWEMKYHVSIQYMLGVIVPFYTEKFKKHKRGNAQALGINIPTLVGKHAERLIKQQIEYDFPQAEHLSIWRWERIQEIVKGRTSDEFDEEIKTPPLVKVGSVGKYVRRYRAKIENSRRDFERELNRTTNTLRPYRGNPFI